MNKTVYAYIDGIRLWDVLQLALVENVMLNNMKKRLREENKDFDVEFRVEKIDNGYNSPPYTPFVKGCLPIEEGFVEVAQTTPYAVRWRLCILSEQKKRAWETAEIEDAPSGRKRFTTFHLGDIYLDELESMDEMAGYYWSE